jgi:SH3-like domain-containing protein
MKIFMARRSLAVSIGVVAIICIGVAVALAQQRYVYSTEANVAIRTGPGAEYPIVTSVNPGTMLEATQGDTNTDWLCVKTKNGKVGWVPKRSITYEKSPAVFPDAKKGVADFHVAKQQVTTWWGVQGTNATPVCDICNVRVPRNTGYLLSARQVLGSKAYHEMLKASFPGQYSALIRHFQHDKTPWLICEKCISKYFVNVPGGSNLAELEKGMLADKALNDNILRAAKKQYSIKQIRDKVGLNRLWLLEDKERNTIYPITPLIGKELLRSLEAEQK